MRPAFHASRAARLHELLDGLSPSQRAALEQARYGLLMRRAHDGRFVLGALSGRQSHARADIDALTAAGLLTVCATDFRAVTPLGKRVALLSQQRRASFQRSHGGRHG